MIYPIHIYTFKNKTLSVDHSYIQETQRKVGKFLFYEKDCAVNILATVAVL